MRLIGKDEILLEKLTGTMSILSAQILKISIYSKEATTCIDLEINLLYKDTKILIHFSDAIEFSFYHSSQYYFYYVETYKFFKSSELFYLSLDPADESELVSNEDQDFIKAKSVSGYIVYTSSL